MTIQIILGKTLEKYHISKNALAREAKVRPNLIYEMCEAKTKRIDLDTLGKIIFTLEQLTGKKHSIADIFEYNTSD